jgi:hypothetical protein
LNHAQPIDPDAAQARTGVIFTLGARFPGKVSASCAFTFYGLHPSSFNPHPSSFIPYHLEGHA